MKSKFPNLKLKGQGKESVNDLKVSIKNKTLINNFLKDIATEGITEDRIQKYRRVLILIAYTLEKDFDKATRQDLKQLNGLINASWYSVWTKNDLRICLRRAYKFWLGENEFYPKEVRDIVKPKNERTATIGLRLPKKMLEKKDVDKLVKLCKNSRDKFMLWLMWDTGIRPCELRDLKWGDIQESGNGLRVTIKTRKESGDFVERYILLYNSPPYFYKWREDWRELFDVFDIKDKDKCFIFTRLNNDRFKTPINPNKPLSHGALAKLFGVLKQKSGMEKLTPYVLRHSKITFWCRKNPEFIVKGLSGHSRFSDAIGNYIHHNSEDLDEAVLNSEGDKEAIAKAKQKTEINEEFKPEKCPRCQQINKGKADICRRCGQPLTMGSAIKLLKEQREFRNRFFESKKIGLEEEFKKMIKEKNGLEEEFKKMIKERFDELSKEAYEQNKKEHEAIADKTEEQFADKLPFEITNDMGMLPPIKEVITKERRKELNEAWQK